MDAGSNARGGMEELSRLLEMLENPSWQVRAAAAEGLGEFGGDRARFTLSTLARDRMRERPEVRVAALRALGNITPPGRYASFLEEFIAGDNRKVVAGARRLLAGLDPASYPGRLAAKGCLDHSATGVYGRCSEKSAGPLLREFLEQKLKAGELAGARDWGRVFAAVKALGTIGGADAVSTLGAVLERAGAAPGAPSAFLERERLEKIRAAALRSLGLAER